MPNEEQDAWIRSFGMDPDAVAAPAHGSIVSPTVAAGPAPQGGGIDAGPAPPTSPPTPPQTPPSAAQKRLDELAAQSQRLRDAGLDTTALDIEIKHLTARLAAARGARQLAGLETTIAKVVAEETKDADRQLAAATTGSDRAIHDLLDGIGDQIKKVPDTNTDKTGYATDLRTLDTQLTAAEREADPAKRKAALATIDQAARALLKKVAEVTKDAKAVQAVYAKALQEKYGFTIGKSAKLTPNTHFDAIYDMFDKVPISNIVHDKLNYVAYDPASANFDAYLGGGIVIGEFGENPVDITYRDTDTLADERHNNSFNISVLHEVGHSVDKRWGIMEAHKEKSGCGSWQSESPERIAAAAMRTPIGRKLTGVATLAEAAIKATLLGGSVDRTPEFTDDAAWEILLPLLNTCSAITVGMKPWAQMPPPMLGDRVYMQSYPDQWWSYPWAARNGPLFTTDYQWRSPAEWFAEIYAFTWSRGVEPGQQVEAAVRDYMFKKNAPPPPP